PVGGVQNFLDSEKEKDKNGLSWGDYSITFAQDRTEYPLDTMLGGRAAYPMTVIVDAKGKITKVIQGSCNEATLRQAILQAQNG
ncbi:MAG: hypothetical protein ACI4MB_01035, partial [Candidatus Coproplasma sp.]